LISSITELLATAASLYEFTEIMEERQHFTLRRAIKMQFAPGRIVGIYSGEPLAETLDARCALVDEIFCDAKLLVCKVAVVTQTQRSQLALHR
jgi:hypothetical protein